MKKMINNPDNIVDEMLNGLVAAHPDYVKTDHRAKLY